MENLKNCSHPNCPKIAHSLCNCLPTLPVFCQKHISDHIDIYPRMNHSFDRVFISLSLSQQQKLLEIQKMQRAKKFQSLQKTTEQFQENIKNIQNTLNDAQCIFLYELRMIESEYNSVMETCQQYLIEKGVLSQDSQIKNFLNFLQRFGSQFYPTKLLPSIHYSPQTFLYYFENTSQIFCKLQIQTMKIQKRLIPSLKSNMGQDSMFKLGKTWILYTGSQFKGPPFVINTNDFQVKPFPVFPNNSIRFGALTIYNDDLFHFGGILQQDNSKTQRCYIFLKNTWKQICHLPFPSGKSSALVVGNKILVTGLSISKILSYFPKYNRFQVLFQGLQLKTKHLLLTQKGEVICVVGSSDIYVGRGKDLTEWTKQGKSGPDMRSISNAVYIGEYIFYINQNAKLVRISSETYKQDIINLNQSYSKSIIIKN